MKTNNNHTKTGDNNIVYQFFGSKLFIALLVSATLVWLYIGYIK